MTDRPSKAEFARERGVSRQHIDRLIREGLPVERNGRIDRKKASAWLKRHTGSRDKTAATSIATARCRKSAVQVRILLDKADALEASLVRVSAMREAYQTIAAGAANAAMAMSVALSPQFVGKPAEVIQDLLGREIHAMLTTLGGGPADVAASDDEPTQPAPPKRQLPKSEAKLAALRLTAQARIAELHHGKASGELESRSEACDRIFWLTRGMRDQFLALAPRIAVQLSAARDVAAVESIVISEFILALDVGDGLGHRARGVKSVVAALRRVAKAA